MAVGGGGLEEVNNRSKEIASGPATSVGNVLEESADHDAAMHLASLNVLQTINGVGEIEGLTEGLEKGGGCVARSMVDVEEFVVGSA